MTTRSEIVKRLRNIIVQQTNKRGYVDITDETASAILSDLESILGENVIQYAEETVDAQLDLPEINQG